MSAIYRFTGTTSGAWATNTNWSPNPPSTQAGPGEGDTAVFDVGAATNALTGTDQRYVLPPTGLGTSGASSTGGFLTGGQTYKYLITSTNSRGESVVSSELSYAVPSGTSTNQITIGWTAAGGATGYKIYRTAAGGASNSELLLATIAGGSTVSYVDDTNTTPSGAFPVANTAAILLAAIYVYASYTLTRFGGVAGTPFRANASLWRIGIPAPGGQSFNGCGAINIDIGTLTASVVIESTSTTPTDSGLDPVRIQGNFSSCAVSALSGNVGLGNDTPADTPTFGTISVANQAQVDFGYTVTYGALVNDGGTVNCWSIPTTSIRTLGGSTYLWGTAQVPAVYAEGGTTYPNGRYSAGSPDIVNLYMWGGAVDASQDGRGLTIGTMTKRAGVSSSLTAFSDTQLTINAEAIDWNGKTQINFS